MAEAKKEEKSIEDTFGELDLLARKLEDKETPLEESFRLYRQGMELLKDLNGRLDTVEKKMLQMNEDGTFREFKEELKRRTEEAEHVIREYLPEESGFAKPWQRP